MKPLYIIFGLVTFFSSLLMAEPRSVLQRINGDGTLERSYTVQLNKAIDDGTPLGRTSVVLNTPYLVYPDSKLNLDDKRSIMILAPDHLLDLDKSLVSEIKKVINNKGPVKFRKAGISNFIIFANFSHSRTQNDKAEFYISIVPKKINVKQVIFQAAWFGNGAGAHNQVRLVFDQAFVAIPQSGDHTPQIIANDAGVADIIYSLQATSVEGGKASWDPLLGLMGEYGNSLQFFSTQAKAKTQIVHSVVKQYEILNLSQKQKNAIFQTALTISDKEQETGIYNTVFNSCIVHALRALKGTPGEGGRYNGMSELNVDLFNPYSVLERISEAHPGGTQFLGTLNEDYYYLAGNQLMTEEIRKNSKLYKELDVFAKTILKSEAFDQIIRRIALFIIDNEITAEQAQQFIAEATKENARLSAMMETEAGKLIVPEVSKLWKKRFGGQPVEDFFLALKGLKTQDLQ